jgi:hypothetical protein
VVSPQGLPICCASITGGLKMALGEAVIVRQGPKLGAG